MFYLNIKRERQSVATTVFFLLFVSLFTFLMLHSGEILAQKGTPVQDNKESLGEQQKVSENDIKEISDFLPLEITPEGLFTLKKAGNIPFVLIDADQLTFIPERDDRIRRIYYTPRISTRAAKNAVLQDRRRQRNRADHTIQPSQRLTGTPTEWEQFDIEELKVIPKKPLLVTPKELSEAIKDEVDLQIIDLRPPEKPALASTSAFKSDPQKSAGYPFPKALSLMPHQIESALPEISKKRWLIIIDDGHHEAQIIADQLFQQKFMLIGILDGGYPAWVTATDR
ncbi:MAG: hypothetical protein LBS40_05620 [Burkholderiales bacterium]|nr:hypothetical protein [Burkholderiales bacterium]